jgi:hypothetical protein
VERCAGSTRARDDRETGAVESRGRDEFAVLLGGATKSRVSDRIILVDFARVGTDRRNQSAADLRPDLDG